MSRPVKFEMIPALMNPLVYVPVSQSADSRRRSHHNMTIPAYRSVAALAIALSCLSRCHGSSMQSDVSMSAPIWKDTMMQRIGAKVMGESALIDKETGRIFWEGGPKTSATASIAPILSDLGLHRLKSTLLSIALMSCLIYKLTSSLRIRLREISQPISWRTAVFIDRKSVV